MNSTRLATLLTAAALSLAGCSSSSADPGDSMGDMPGMSHSDRPVEFSVTVASGEVSPAPTVHDVELGSTVELTVTSDVADEVHLHGYDEHLDLEAGTPGTLTFTADIPGDFEAELEAEGLQLLEFRVE